MGCVSIDGCQRGQYRRGLTIPKYLQMLSVETVDRRCPACS
jgi:hypothetical protein